VNTLRSLNPFSLVVLFVLFVHATALAQSQLCMRWVDRADVGSPGERRHHKMVYDSDRGVMVLFGGAAGDDYLQGTQEYDGTRWRQIIFAGVQPSHRAYHAMAYDAQARKVVLYGGFAGGLYGLDDTWTYQGDGVNGVWTHAFGSSFNTGLAGSALVYDTTRRQIIRYGGVTTPFEDPPGFEIPYFDRHTYEWRASTWVDSLATNGPGLYGIGMAFDQRRGLAVIVGGFGTIDEEDRTDHVWEYNGIGWRDLGPTLPGRGYPAIAYDSKRGRLVVVGGDGGQGNTAIEYHPNFGWVQLPPFPHFGRAGAGMAYDSRREKMVFMGGAGAGETWDDTWELETIPMTLTLIAPAPGTVLCQENPPTLYGQTTDGRSLAYQWLLNGAVWDGATNLSFTLPTNLWEGPVTVQLKAIDFCGNVFLSAETNLFIHTPPRIFYDHSDRFLCPGDSLVVPTTIQSTLEPVAYQWFFKGVPIDRGTNATLSLLTLAHENTGSYLLRARNACGDTFSQEMYVQVGVTIPCQPTNTMADVCQTAGFSVGARGVGTLRYQWRLDGVPLSNDAYFSGVTTSNLTVRPCLYAYEGNYDVVVTDDCGSIHSVTSRVAKLTIKPGPEWVLRATNGPSARTEPAMAYDHERKVTLLFGGGQMTDGAFRTLGDLWEWDGARWLQRQTHSPSNGWTYSVATGWQPSYSGQPVPRYRHNLVYDNIRRRFVLFGGETRTPDPAAQQVFLNDVWEWDGTAWYFRATNGPALRSRASMAFDSRRGVTVMTGGFLNTVDPAPGAVWEWDGVSWQMRAPTNGPALNYSQETGAMVYDSFHRTILFGPSVGEQYGWTFRTWNGTNWTKVFEDFVPQFFLQQYGDMAFDNYRRRAVWFGGQSGPSDTTGFFDGQNWEVLTGSPATPSPRYNVAMAYDTNRHATVMFGGETGAQNFNGQTWELIALDVPLINDQPASQYHPAGQTVVFHVSARGPTNSALQYQWFKNGQLLATGGRVSGATSSQLRVSNILPGDAGTYSVRIRNDCGVTASLPAILTLNAGLQIFSAADTVTLIWSDPAVVLEQADAVTGPWTAMPGATSPFSLAAVGPGRFFRLAVAP
jgi:hypothetical protein